MIYTKLYKPMIQSELLDTIVFGIISTFCTDEPTKLIPNQLAKDRSYYYEDHEQKRTYRNGLLHSIDDKPAIIDYSEVEDLHMDDMFSLSIINDNGHQEWYKNGKRHRDNNQPAVICVNGNLHWYKNGMRYRDPCPLTGKDRPAVKEANGTQAWFKNGQLHRDPDPITGKDQPAIIESDGTFKFYKNYKQYYPKH